VLTLSTMLFGDEVLSPDRLDELDAIEDAEASDRELKMAQQLIDSLSSEFDPGKYHDEYRERVLELIEKKAAGEEIAVQPEAEEPTAAPDLMAALEASLAALKDEDSEPAPSKPPKRAAAAGDGDGDGDGAKAKAKAKAKKPRAKARS
jgi:DNA end-binding protein Ku